MKKDISASLYQNDSTKCAPQYELDSFATMATYGVPELPNIKGFSGHLWRSILYWLIVARVFDPASI